MASKGKGHKQTFLPAMPPSFKKTLGVTEDPVDDVVEEIEAPTPVKEIEPSPVLSKGAEASINEITESQLHEPLNAAATSPIDDYPMPPGMEKEYSHAVPAPAQESATEESYVAPVPEHVAPAPEPLRQEASRQRPPLVQQPQQHYQQPHPQQAHSQPEFQEPPMHQQDPNQDHEYAVAPPALGSVPQPDPDEVLYSAHPAMFSNNPSVYLMYVLMIPILIGVFGFIFWRVQIKNSSLKVKGRIIYFEEGVFTKARAQINVDNTRAIKITQTFTQRMLNTGDVHIFTGGDAPEVIAKGYTHLNTFNEIVNRLKANSPHAPYPRH